MSALHEDDRYIGKTSQRLSLFGSWIGKARSVVDVGGCRVMAARVRGYIGLVQNERYDVVSKIVIIVVVEWVRNCCIA